MISACYVCESHSRNPPQLNSTTMLRTFTPGHYHTQLTKAERTIESLRKQLAERDRTINQLRDKFSRRIKR